MFLFPIEVECHAGHKSNEVPRAFRWMGRRIEAVEILDRWYEGGMDPTRPIEDYFKIRGDDGGSYLLRHRRSLDDWHLCVRMD